MPDTNILSGDSSPIEVQSVLQGATTVYRQIVTARDSTATGTITATDAVVGTHSGAGAVLTGTPTAGSYVAFPVAGGESGFTLRLSGTFGGGTVWMESSPDSTNGVDGGWATNLVRQSGIDVTFVDASITGPGIFRGVAAGYSYLRVRVTGATAPSITVAMRASTGPSVTAQVASLPPGSNTIGGVTVTGPTTATRTSVTAAAADTSILAASTTRAGFTLYNDSTATLYLCLGTATATAATMTRPIEPGGYYEAPYGYRGAVRGIWTAANGAARVTELV